MKKLIFTVFLLAASVSYAGNDAKKDDEYFDQATFKWITGAAVVCLVIAIIIEKKF